MMESGSQSGEGTIRGFTQNNLGYDSANVLQIRLNCDDVMSKIETYLRGEIVKLEIGDDGQQRYKTISLGRAKANDEGIQQIMSIVTCIVNPQVVQGCLTDDRYNMYLYDLHVDLVYVMGVNMYSWGIREADLVPIRMFIMNLVEPFMSRTIDDGERKSYAQTIRHSEASTVRERGGGWKLWGGS